MPGKQLKILYVVNEIPALSTPFILNQIVGMIVKGHKVLIWSRLKGDLTKVQSEFDTFNIINHCVFLDSIPESINARVIYLIKNSYFIFKNPKLFFNSINLFRYGKYAISLRLFHETFGFSKSPDSEFDIIHAQFGPLGMMLQRFKDMGLVKGKLITNFRGYDVSRLIKLEGTGYYNYLFSKGDFYLANSEFFMNQAIELGAPQDRIKVQYSGVQIEKFIHRKTYPVKSKNDFVRMGSVSRLSGKKGYSYCLRAIKLLKDKGYNFTYEIIGDGELKTELVQLSEELNLTDRVFFLGRKPHSEISKFLKEIDLFISHNVTSSQGDQDAPVNTLKEAMLAGAIVFSTYHGGIPELVEPDYNGYLSEEKDIDALAELIENKFYGNHELDKVAMRAIDTVQEKFDNNKLNNQLESTYFHLTQE